MNPLPGTLMTPLETHLCAGAALTTLDACAAFGARGLLVCGHSLERTGRLERILNANRRAAVVQVWRHPGGEPTLGQLELLLETARDHNPDWIAAIGGGSVLDIAKAGAGLLDAPESVRAYHDGAPIPHSHRVFIAVPTTAGTGSEATSVSVLTNSDTGVKKSIRHPSFLARLVLLDPDLLSDCPPEIVAASGMDAFTQAVESYCSKGATWYTDTLALKAAALISASLVRACHGEDTARADMLIGSYLAGIALSNARLGLAHGLAHPLGARYRVPHGLTCAACLPQVLVFNRDAMAEKYERLSEAVKMPLLDYVNSLLDTLNIRSPFSGKTLVDRDAIIEETRASGSTKANPRDVTADDISQLLDAIFS